MRKIGILGLVGVFALVLAGCGGGDGPHTVVIQSLSDQPVDGDIGFTAPATFSISQADVTRNVLYGIDSGGTEFRAFLDFPLNGSNGGGVVPLSAVIVSADIEVFVNNVSFSTSVPTLLDLVPFPATGLTSADFDSAPLLTRSLFDIRTLDINNFVRIDVTSLMREAQRLGLRDLQLRFLLDLVAPSGLVQLDDGVAGSAPLLTVEYR
ncbi:hypothetical protein [Candidatus Deferrimicrobium sp.]|uniref:hypothetical protein n=1 Tax=Candidatus Deferrimicrobium sp. TaxID=3060586 RepID=UPI003C5961A8